MDYLLSFTGYKLKQARFKKAYDIYKHDDTNYHNRFSYFIVAESMFFVSYATFSVNRFGLLSELMIISIAIGYTLSWWIVNYRLTIRLDFLTNTYLMKDNMYKAHIKTAKEQDINTIADFLPCFTFLAWSIFGLITLKNHTGTLFEFLILGFIWGFIVIIILIHSIILKNIQKK